MLPKIAGHTEEEVLTCIAKAVGSLVASFRFGYYDEDDLRQEGFMFACEALPRFDPNNSKSCGLTSFLRTHVRNRFINLRRDKLHRNSPPCLVCCLKNIHVIEKNSDFTHGQQECLEFDDKTECPKWSGWYLRNNAKRSLVESCDVSNISYIAPVADSDICTKLSHAELLQYVSNEIPLALRGDYNRLIEGARLNKAKRDAVVDAVRLIVGGLLDDNKKEE